ncbi:UDP-N-acetylmuramoyl-tripeptide--D-alanyl-D-alanine ligase, partial [Candidatus Peregrinibacteria bacterium]|nr:UDP-N-acetylmuramoyl-tripeptide--D-alanyl-D-alanine ligase [Candidatus Peregrinibacteria bacterium]
SDFGVLLTILDIESGFSSATKWSWYLLKGFVNSFRKEYSEILLLEFGVDKPGDMDFLLSVVKPDVAVMTNIFQVHIDEGQFKDPEDIFEEKSKLVKALKNDGKAILNVDNDFTAKLAKKGTVTFGAENEADYMAGNIQQSIEGLSFILKHEDKKYEVLSPILGKYQVYTIMPAIICGHLFGMTIEETIMAVRRYNLPPGRLSIISGVNDSTILDSSYNSSPAAVKEALKVLKEIAGDGRKVAVLGTMNELGKESENLHKIIGGIVPEYADVLITVGDQAEIIAETARGKNMKEVHSFKTSDEAAKFFREKVKKNDLILAKGSQNNVRLERFVKALMAHPEDAKELLVRQEKIWQARL